MFQRSLANLHHPMLLMAQPSEAPTQPTVPLCDRKVNQEAMLLGFMAQRSMPFTMAPDIVDLSKALASDPKALNELSMDRTTASYKMRHGLAKTMEDEVVHDLKNNKFSMNIDEALSQVGISGNFIKIIQNMYSSVMFSVKCNTKITAPFSSTVGVKQGCVLSPMFF